jgi:hypothetical protein
LLEKASDDLAMLAAIENKVGEKWDDQFGHCFPDMMKGVAEELAKERALECVHVGVDSGAVALF